MTDSEDREDWRRERSLLALGQAMRGESGGSLLSAANQSEEDWRDDAAARHRLARSRREARQSPVLAALAEGGGPAMAGTPASPAANRPVEAANDEERGRISRLMPKWLRKEKAAGIAADDDRGELVHAGLETTTGLGVEGDELCHWRISLLALSMFEC